METNADGTYFQEGDLVRVKRTGERGRINAADGGVVYVLMEVTDETRIFLLLLMEMLTSNLSPPSLEWRWKHE